MPVTVEFDGKTYTLSQAGAWVDALHNHLCSQLLPARGWAWLDFQKPATLPERGLASVLRDESGIDRGSVIRRADGTFEAWAWGERVHTALGAEAIEDVNDGKYYVAEALREKLGISWAQELKPEAPTGG